MKKMMAILLATVLVLALSVSAFAVDQNWETIIFPEGQKPTRDDPTQRPAIIPRNVVTIEIGPMEEPEEDNPTTGAPVLNFIPAAAVIAGTVLLLRKKK